MAQAIDISDLSVVKEIVAKRKDMPGCLMTILQETQEAYGYLPFELQEVIAEDLDIPVSDVYGVTTFYSQFTLTKKGEFKIGVCMGTACYVKNAQAVVEALEKELKIKAGQTTEDYKFTLEATRCLGCCGLAPVMMINDDVYGGLAAEDIPGIIKSY